MMLLSKKTGGAKIVTHMSSLKKTTVAFAKKTRACGSNYRANTFYIKRVGLKQLV